jgi:hypothetical protein
LELVRHLLLHEKIKLNVHSLIQNLYAYQTFYHR